MSIYDDNGMFVGEVMMMRLHSGRKANPMNLQIEDVITFDIAHSLARQCRFNGHCAGFISVANHCTRVSAEVEMYNPYDYELQLKALLHDAAEAYLGDLTRPMKYSGAFAAYFQAEEIAEKAIAAAYGLDSLTDERIKDADNHAVLWELEQAWTFESSPREDERAFLSRYDWLQSQR